MKKKIIFLVVISLLCVIFVSPLYAKENDSYNSEQTINEIYTGDNTISIKRTRGNCTDIYSREWCNAHGYASNRPVGARVQLNDREISCLVKLGLSAAELSFHGVTGNIGSALFASAYFAFELWNCKR